MKLRLFEIAVLLTTLPVFGGCLPWGRAVAEPCKGKRTGVCVWECRFESPVASILSWSCTWGFDAAEFETQNVISYSLENVVISGKWARKLKKQVCPVFLNTR